ncbi:MAG: dihydroneopterin aldolase [Schlesneria sp.]
MDTIFIRDLVVRGIIGVNAWEREQPQDFVINIDLDTNVEQAGITDDIVDCVDYQSVADSVATHASTIGRLTVEALAADVAEIVLADSRVDRVRVRIEKPGAVPGSRSVGVEIERDRYWLANRPQSDRPGAIRVDPLAMPTGASTQGLDPPSDLEQLPPEYHSACLGLGSNTNTNFNLSEAIRRLRNELIIDAVSSAWESPAVGDFAMTTGKPDAMTTGVPDYVNAAILVRTRSTKNDLVATLKRIENELGRVRSEDPRKQVTIDIDLLLFDDAILKKDLWNLAYRAMPVAELIPSLPSPETSEPLWKAAYRLATENRILPRFDLLRLTPPLQSLSQFHS